MKTVKCGRGLEGVAGGMSTRLYLLYGRLVSTYVGSRRRREEARQEVSGQDARRSLQQSDEVRHSVCAFLAINCTRGYESKREEVGELQLTAKRPSSNTTPCHPHPA